MLVRHPTSRQLHSRPTFVGAIARASSPASAVERA